MYWPQEKVFLMGIMSLFPEKLLKKPITLDSHWYYFGSKNEDDMVQKLFANKRAGYIDFVEIPILVTYIDKDPDTEDGERTSPLGFMITSINTQKVTDDLTEYLEKWRNDELTTNTAHKPDDHKIQYAKLFLALSRTYGRQTMPHIDIEDVYGNKANNFYNYIPPFWEVVLSPQLINGQYNIRQMDYDLEHEGRAFIEIQITNTALLRSLELKSKSSDPIQEEDLEELNYNDLRASRDGTVLFKEIRIPFTPQEADVMRVFMQRPEEIRPYDSFTDPLANIFNDKEYGDIHATLSKLIYATRKKLHKATNQNAITNTSKRGWTLKIQ